MDICNEYVKMQEQAQNDEKDCILEKITGTKQGNKIQVSEEFWKLDLILEDTIATLNGIFKLPEKIKVTGLSGILSQDDDKGETESSHDSYDDTKVNNLRNEMTNDVREKCRRSGYFYIPMYKRESCWYH